MATETLHFESAQQAQQLFSNETKNLQAIERELGVKAVCRDGWIKLDGNPSSLEEVRRLFELMDASIRAGNPIRNRDFNQSLAILKEHGSEALQKLLEDRITTSPRKAPISPKTSGQKRYLEAIRKYDLTFGIGPAGTGKTYLAVAMAVATFKSGKAERIVLTRPAVEAGEALGFLPGDLYEKLAPYLRPLHDALHDMLPADEIQKHMERGIIEIAPLAYMRGRTLNHSFIILDEAQNATAEQMFMFLTRMGMNSRIVVTGDPTQTDLPPSKPSGLNEACKALKKIPDVAIVEFHSQDVIRHPLIKKIVTAYETHRKESPNAVTPPSAEK